MFDFLKSKNDIILWDEVSAPQRLSLWKATSMRSLSIILLPQLLLTLPSLHKWITTDEIFRDKIKKENYGWHSHWHVSRQTESLGRTSTPLDWKMYHQQHLLPHSTKPHAWSFYLYQWKRKALGRDFCSVHQLSCTVSQVPCSHGKPINDVWTSCWFFDDCSEDPSVVSIPTPCG